MLIDAASWPDAQSYYVTLLDLVNTYCIYALDIPRTIGQRRTGYAAGVQFFDLNTEQIKKMKKILPNKSYKSDEADPISPLDIAQV